MCLPLSSALYYLPPETAAQIVPDLIEAHPEGVTEPCDIKDNIEIPLQVAMGWRVVGNSQLTPELLRVLLEAGHGYGFAGKGLLFFGPEHDEVTAMEMLFENISPDMFNREGPDLERWAEYDERWFQNLCLALRAAGAFKTGLAVENMWDYPLLHGVIEFGNYQYIVDIILNRYNTRADLGRLDALGRSPLVIAIEKAGDNDNHDPIDICFSTMIKDLLDDRHHGWSELASIPFAGTLPLHHALHNGVGLEDGNDYILEAFPAALATIDPKTKLLPCLLAAVGERSRVNTVFGLMIRKPDLIANLCQEIVMTDERA